MCVHLKTPHRHKTKTNPSEAIAGSFVTDISYRLSYYPSVRMVNDKGYKKQSPAGAGLSIKDITRANLRPCQLTFTSLSGDFHSRELLRAAHNPDSWARSVTCPGEAFSRSFGINKRLQQGCNFQRALQHCTTPKLSRNPGYYSVHISVSSTISNDLSWFRLGMRPRAIKTSSRSIAALITPA